MGFLKPVDQRQDLLLVWAHRSARFLWVYRFGLHRQGVEPAASGFLVPVRRSAVGLDAATTDLEHLLQTGDLETLIIIVVAHMGDLIGGSGGLVDAHDDAAMAIGVARVVKEDHVAHAHGMFLGPFFPRGSTLLEVLDPEEFRTFQEREQIGQESRVSAGLIVAPELGGRSLDGGSSVHRLTEVVSRHPVRDKDQIDAGHAVTSVAPWLGHMPLRTLVVEQHAFFLQHVDGGTDLFDLALNSLEDSLVSFTTRRCIGGCRESPDGHSEQANQENQGGRAFVTLGKSHALIRAQGSASRLKKK